MGAIGIAAVQPRAPAARGHRGPVGRRAILPAGVGREILHQPAFGAALEIEACPHLARDRRVDHIVGHVGAGGIRRQLGAVASLVLGPDGNCVRAEGGQAIDRQVMRGCIAGMGTEMLAWRQAGAGADTAAGRLVGRPGHPEHVIVGTVHPGIEDLGRHVVDSRLGPLVALRPDGIQRLAMAGAEEGEAHGSAAVHRAAVLHAGEGAVDIQPAKTTLVQTQPDALRAQAVLRRHAQRDDGLGGGLVGLAVELQRGVEAVYDLDRVAEEVGLVVAPADAVAVDDGGVALVRELVGHAQMGNAVGEAGVPEMAVEALARPVGGVAAAPAVARVPDPGEGTAARRGREVFGDAVVVEGTRDATLRIDKERLAVEQVVDLPVTQLHVVVHVAVPEVVDHGKPVGIGQLGELRARPLVSRPVIEGFRIRIFIEGGEALGRVAVRRAAHADLLHHAGGIVGDAAEAEMFADEEGRAHILCGARGTIGLVDRHLAEPVTHLLRGLGGHASDGHLGVEVHILSIRAVVGLAPVLIVIPIESAVEALVVEVAGQGVGLRAAIGRDKEHAGRNLARIATEQDIFRAPGVVGVADELAYRLLRVVPGIGCQDLVQRHQFRGYTLVLAPAYQSVEGLAQLDGGDDHVYIAGAAVVRGLAGQCRHFLLLFSGGRWWWRRRRGIIPLQRHGRRLTDGIGRQRRRVVD